MSYRYKIVKHPDDSICLGYDPEAPTPPREIEEPLTWHASLPLYRILLGLQIIAISANPRWIGVSSVLYFFATLVQQGVVERAPIEYGINIVTCYGFFTMVVVLPFSVMAREYFTAAVAAAYAIVNAFALISLARDDRGSV